MDREKQIEEMAVILTDGGCTKCNCDENGKFNCLPMYSAVLLYNSGYRKQIEGKWEKFEGERFICSNCAKVFVLGSTATIYDVKRVWKYCRNCRAKMKGGEE